MDSTTDHNNFKMMSQDEIEAHGWNIPSLEQMSKNMDKRLKKIRGENYDDENFLMRYNYKSNYHQA